MTTIAYTALAYGSPYLPWAIRSIIDYVNEYYVLYSPDGSHGHKSTLALPECESRANLYRLAEMIAGDKLRWIDGNWTQEGEQRDSIHTIVPHADTIFVLDYDEIWSFEMTRQILLLDHPRHKRVRLPMVHFWRSFHRAVLHDPAYPTRVIYPHAEGDEEWTFPSMYGVIAHMGYAIPDVLMQYKRGIHGHKAQFRTDVNWWDERWAVNAQKDCHPVGSDYWTPETVDPLDYLPDYMRAHPYFAQELIA